MTAVAASLADYLQGTAYWVADSDAVAEARWGDLGAESAIMSPLDEKADAEAELARQLGFLAHPHVKESLDLPAEALAYRGRCIRVRAAAAGYGGAGALVFVLGIPAGQTADLATGRATVEVLRRLSE